MTKENEVEEDGSIRESLEAAFEASEEAGGSDKDTEESVRLAEEKATAEAATSKAAAEAAVAAAVSSSSEGGDTGDEKPPAGKSEAEIAADKAKAGGEDDKSGGRADDKGGKGGEESPLLKAPQSWKAGPREKWGDLPNNVREEIHRREREASVAIQQNSESAKYGDAMQAILKPFEAVMAMEAGTPFEAVHNLARAGATLRMGVPTQKAEMIASLCKQYDVDIELLDSALAGEAMQTPEEKRMSSMMEETLKPYKEFMAQVKASQGQNQQQQNISYDDEIAKFAADPSNEFYGDVREDMADIIELRARRGNNMTLQEAYDFCINAKPELSEIMKTRGKADFIRKAAAKAEEKKKAAISVASSTPTPKPASVNNGEDLRADLENAWNTAESAN